MCLERERPGSKVTPRFRAVVEGLSTQPERVSVAGVIFERCCWVPIKRNSVLLGFRARQLEDSQR